MRRCFPFIFVTHLPNARLPNLRGHILAIVFTLVGPWIFTVPSNSSGQQDLLCMKESDATGKAIAVTDKEAQEEGSA